MAEPYKLPEVPASIKTQLAMLHSTVADAQKKLDSAKADIQTINETFYGLVGKLVTYREQQYRRVMTYTVLVTRLVVDPDGALRCIAGNVQTKQDLKTGFKRTYGIEKHIHSGQIEQGHMTVISDAPPSA